MGIEENKAIIKRFWEECNKGNYDVIDELCADNFVNYRINGTTMDKAGYKRLFQAISQASPDTQATIGEMVGEGDLVAFYFILAGTNTGEIAGNPPTGKRFSMMESYFARFKGGKIIEFRNFQAQRKDEE
ncbi:MAG TPA: ester cyclase [Dehalococcoidia bacterium]|nr:ester cyclase [Dehalococcoidia bacterium]